MRTHAIIVACAVAAVGSLLAVISPVSAQADSRYRLRPDDILEVQYRYTPEFAQTVSVGPDGYVNLHLFGSVKFGGLTVDEAQAAVLERARTRLRDPELTLILKEYEKNYVTVAGQVGKPGKVEMKGPLTVMEAIAIAGGLREDAKQSQVLLLRRFSADEFETQVLDVKYLMTPEGVQADVALRPNDLLVVPQDRVGKVDRVLKVLNLGSYLTAAALLGLGQ